MREKIYVGILPNLNREVFRSTTSPTEEMHSDKYILIVGPYLTLRGARFAEDYAESNPHIQTVGDAEVIAYRFKYPERGGIPKSWPKSWHRSLTERPRYT